MEEAFFETAKKIYQNIQDGRHAPPVAARLAARPIAGSPLRRRPRSLDLNAAESGVQHKAASTNVALTDKGDTQGGKGCAC